MDKKQKMRFSDAELGIIKSVFSENDDLLKSLRKFFLDLELNAVDTNNIDTQIKPKPEVLKLLRKTFRPTLDGEAPFHQVIDLWFTVDLKGKTSDIAIEELASRGKLIKYLDAKLSILEGKEVENITFDSLDYSEDKTDSDNFIDVVTRNTLIGHVEMQLTQLLTLAGLKDETVDDTLDKLKLNSTK